MSKDQYEEELASDGRLYYYNPKTGESTWTNPENAERNDSYFWKKSKDADGHIFYYNSRTKESVWKRPAEYDSKIEKLQETEFRRKNFFKMMSSSVQKDLNPIQYNSPSIFTINEASARFDTDPRLIDATEAQRERFFDEWLTLERKRRVELEKKMVVHAKERLKEKMFEMVEAGKFTIHTKWTDMINELRHNTDWRILLNYDRFEVFVDVKKAVHDEYVLTFNEEREQRTKQETIRRIKFIKAIKSIIDNSEIPIMFMTFNALEEEITKLPEFIEMGKNVTGSTAVDLFYDVLEEKMELLDKKAEEIQLNENDLDFPTFCEHFKDILNDSTSIPNNELNNNEQNPNESENNQSKNEEIPMNKFNDGEIRYIFECCVRDYLLRKDFISTEEKVKKDAFLHILKLNAQLVNCTSYDEARRLLAHSREFLNIDDEEERKAIFEEFVEWGKDRTCEPGEIIKGDDDWEDIGPMIENEIRKRQFGNRQE
ncbi:WW domain containing protein [Tritrichomonas foetus]|uniref:WW domain containing protein n=1 Tax=Tritrichomonas foetus TaxID=1144522 RepID=A0A1J4JVH3_9EUKA|nr:WW domain containing protein [Tritrichomonas foetus]|eukprot:OHT03129.1 WW domain containing protein [Tritrichomonas foetus]